MAARGAAPSSAPTSTSAREVSPASGHLVVGFTPFMSLSRLPSILR
jgi:hypothetical protein